MVQGVQDSRESRTLDFGADEESLPWLESGEDETQTGYDTTRLIGIGLLMVVALGVIVGAIWWVSNSRTPRQRACAGRHADSDRDGQRTRACRNARA